MTPKANESRTQDERVDIRRSDRAMLDNSDITALLHEGQVAFIATCQENQPFVIPNLYWYNPGKYTIYFHTAIDGRTRTNVENNPNVSLSVASMGKLLPADKAIEFSVEYSSVCVFGKARIIDNEEEARLALQGLLDKYFPDHKAGEDYRPITHSEIHRTAVFAVEIESWSGKQRVEGS